MTGRGRGDEAHEKNLKLSVSFKNIKAIVMVSGKDFKVIKCSRERYCRLYLSVCPKYCPVIVAAKDFVYKRRNPRAHVEILT